MEYERAVRRNRKFQDEFRGCLVGGAIGDALGYPLEGMRAKDIFRKYGEAGVREYILSENGTALISANTQMTLFTATGLLLGKTRGMMRGIGGPHWDYVAFSYRTWYRMQMGWERNDFEYSWLADVPEMGASRAPGKTCLSVIADEDFGTLEKPVNNSKGCGALTRVAPVGLYFNRLPFSRDGSRYVNWVNVVWEFAASTAALTHGHELGWMSAAVLAHIINVLCFTEIDLWGAIGEAQELLQKYYGDRKYVDKLDACIGSAVHLVTNDKPDLENIRELGEGWVAEETLAIAIYCSLKYREDFSRAICAAVNHDGDSDATGAVTGSILGTLYGYDGIPGRWKDKLECRDVILEVADDLCHDCQIEEYGPDDEVWETKYMSNRRYPQKRQLAAGSQEELKDQDVSD